MRRRWLSTATVSFRNDWIGELGVVGGLAAAFLALLIVVNRSAPTSIDRWLAAEIQAIPWGALAFVPRLGSEFGGGRFGFYVLPAVAAAVFALRRNWRLLALLVAVYILHFAAISPKLFITAHRPSSAFGVEGAGGLQSFPSGHVQWAVSFYGFLAYLAWRAAPARLRPAVVPIYGAGVLATMLGRIELGKHWPVDTIAGVLAGLIALRLIIAFDVRSLWPGSARPAMSSAGNN